METLYTVKWVKCKNGIIDVVRVAAMGGVRNVRPTNVLYNALESRLGS